jgi:hypothetical protein
MAGTVTASPITATTAITAAITGSTGTSTTTVITVATDMVMADMVMDMVMADMVMVATDMDMAVMDMAVMGMVATATEVMGTGIDPVRAAESTALPLWESTTSLAKSVRGKRRSRVGNPSPFPPCDLRASPEITTGSPLPQGARGF